MEFKFQNPSLATPLLERQSRGRMEAHKLDSLEQELDALQALLADIATVTARSDDERRRDLVRLRRSLAGHIAVVGQAGDEAFRTTDDHKIFRLKYSRMRSTAAMHQASWPAVRLGEHEAEFRASAKAMRDANTDFMQWARAAIKRLNR